MNRWRTTGFLSLLLALICPGCIDKTLKPIGDLNTHNDPPLLSTDATETNPDAGTDNGTDTELLRVSLSLSDDAEDNGFVIEQESNTADIQARWYPYDDNRSVLHHMTPFNGGICAAGEVFGSLDHQNYIGIGLSLCYTRPTDPRPYTMETLSQCPMLTNYDQRLVGVAFTLNGTFPESRFGLHLKERTPENRHPPYFSLTTTGPKEFWFENALTVDEIPFDPGQLFALQFHIDNDSSTPLSFDFCVENIELLLRP